MIDKRTILNIGGATDLFNNVDLTNSLAIKFDKNSGIKKKPSIRELKVVTTNKNKNALF